MRILGGIYAGTCPQYLLQVLTRSKNFFHRNCLHKRTFADYVELFVNEKPVKVPNYYTILRAAASVGEIIPIFCYHERLAIAGNCRMCLVEIEGSPKPQVACSTPVAKGMKVKTESKLALNAREAVMEFLLVNHPLDCPVCDQGGECDLQDFSMRHGSDRSRFVDINFSGKRAVEDKDLGPLIRTEMTRCIHCTKCIRFANEVAGCEVLGTTGRGGDMQIGTYVDKMFLSEMSANVVDLCPVGALTSRPYTFKARPWELSRTASIDTMDACGANITICSRTNELQRILPREHAEINQDWLADKSRFACDALRLQRLVTPQAMRYGCLTGVSWIKALSDAACLIQDTNPEALVAVAGPQTPVEALVVAKDLLNALGSDQTFTERSLNFCTSGTDFRASYTLNMKMKEFTKADKILLIGTNPRFEAPILNCWLRRAYTHNDADIFTVGECCDLNYEFQSLGETTEALQRLACEKEVDPPGHFLNAGYPLILVGIDQLATPHGSMLMFFAHKIAERFKGRLANGWQVVHVVGREASVAGALEAGWSPHSHCSVQRAQLLLLLGADEFLTDACLPEDCNIIYIGSQGDTGSLRAKVALPGAAYTEQDGTYLNMEGRPQPIPTDS